ncbi:MAG TPA: hypothetical protein H9968_05325 [Candidatus Anaerobutyricum stercoris]|uniref:Uncharacterized protein n=1 Tax=Candidatus Anaerobutyricum stercoris TaxID=2838457 RepID=A0A9D2EL17_9FIRM|nr:hypothetical protein [Eubacterium sp. An11]OUQ67282.1 hypothetical protein B5E53_08745 [Eubacterium sp. An11]CVI71439.1 hypothetical protein BN3660_02236 [Eubacteriaceae bacterium CHKCI004]HIZ39340.1 hypothetical protein [Candidatus Anaerobutyricum stercoris]
MENKYTYHFELSQELPGDIPLKPVEKLTSEKPWYGHSYGDRVGRIYLDGRKESFFVKDQEQGGTKLFDQMLAKNVTYPHVHSMYDRKTGETYDCEDHYILRDVAGHSSLQPTLTDDALDTCMNVGFTYHYEILLVLDMEWKRYISQTVQTHGPFTYGLYDIITSLGDIIEEWAEAEENGFRKDEDGIHALFYNLIGEEIEESFPATETLLLYLNSVRIYGMERMIDEK